MTQRISLSRGLCAALLLATIGCAGSRDGSSDDDTGADSGTNGGTTVTGSLNGTPFTARSSSATRFTVEGFGAVREPGRYLHIRVSESGTTCNPQGFPPLMELEKRTIDLEIRVEVSDPAPSAGTFSGTARVLTLRPQSCVNGLMELTGLDNGDASITLTSVGASVKGTFRTTLESGIPLEGTFDAPLCTAFDWEQSRKVDCTF